MSSKKSAKIGAPDAPRVNGVRSSQTRDKILNAAIALFARQGFEGTSLQDIASRADVRRSLILYHFASKDDLWKCAAITIVDRFDAEVQRRMALIDHLEDNEFRERNRALWLSIYRDIPEVAQFLVREGGEPSDRLTWLVEKVGYGGLNEKQLSRYRSGSITVRRLAINTLTLATVALAPLLHAKLSALGGEEEIGDVQDAMLEILNSVG